MATNVPKALLICAMSTSMNMGGEMFEIGDDWFVKLKKDGHKYTCRVFSLDNGLGVVKEGRYINDEQAVTLLTRDMAHWFRYELWPKKPSESIKEWYKRAAPDDELGDELADVSFTEYLIEVARTGNYYVCGIDDSIVRQRIQAALAEVMGTNVVYDLWRD